MTKFENMVVKYENLKTEKTNEINLLKEEISKQDTKLKEYKFDNDVLTNDNESKAFQLSKMEQRCQK